MDRAMAVVQYRSVGEQVTYESLAGQAKTVYAIITATSTTAAGIDVRAPEADIVGRVQSADVTTPRRGDTITDADGTVYEVDGVIEETRVEWILQLRRCNG
jgi:hypothetical protein